MRARVLLLSLLFCGCRAIEGLGGLQYDLDGGAAGSGGGVHPPEDCTNGVDDDGDGLVDCADPECAAQGFACTGGVPDGWSGPAEVYEGAPSAAAPACADLYPTIAFAGGTGPQGVPATCATCTCTPADATCMPAQLTTYNGNNCNGAGSSFDTPSGVCVKFSGSPDALRTGDVMTPQSTCSVIGGASQISPVTWATSAIACGGATVGKGCAGQGVCAPRAEAPFGAHRCVYRSGDHDCPPSYPQKRPFMQAADDRACAPCECADHLPTCSMTTTLYTDGACQTAITDMPSPGSCAKLSVGSVMVTLTSSGPPTCDATGGTPTGGVQTTTTTFCCE